MFRKKYFIKGLDWAKLGAFALLGLLLPSFLSWNYSWGYEDFNKIFMVLLIIIMLCLSTIFIICSRKYKSVSITNYRYGTIHNKLVCFAYTFICLINVGIVIFIMPFNGNAFKQVWATPILLSLSFLFLNQVSAFFELYVTS